MRAVENLPRDPRKKLSHDIKKFSRGSCKVRWRSRHSTRKKSFMKGEKDYRKNWKGRLLTKFLKLVAIGYRDTFLQIGRNLPINFTTVFLERPLKTFGKSLYMMVRLVLEKNLGESTEIKYGDLQLIETMKTIKPSTSSKNIKEQL